MPPGEKTMSELLRRARALPLLLLLAACAAFQPAAERQPPIVFVHGNGDTRRCGIPPSGALSRTATIAGCCMRSISVSSGAQR